MRHNLQKLLDADFDSVAQEACDRGGDLDQALARLDRILEDAGEKRPSSGQIRKLNRQE